MAELQERQTDFFHELLLVSIQYLSALVVQKGRNMCINLYMLRCFFYDIVDNVCQCVELNNELRDPPYDWMSFQVAQIPPPIVEY